MNKNVKNFILITISIILFVTLIVLIIYKGSCCLYNAYDTGINASIPFYFAKTGKWFYKTENAYFYPYITTGVPMLFPMVSLYNLFGSNFFTIQFFPVIYSMLTIFIIAYILYKIFKQLYCDYSLSIFFSVFTCFVYFFCTTFYLYSTDVLGDIFSIGTLLIGVLQLYNSQNDFKNNDRLLNDFIMGFSCSLAFLTKNVCIFFILSLYFILFFMMIFKEYSIKKYFIDIFGFVFGFVIFDSIRFLSFDLYGYLKNWYRCFVANKSLDLYNSGIQASIIDKVKSIINVDGNIFVYFMLGIIIISILGQLYYAVKYKRNKSIVYSIISMSGSSYLLWYVLTSTYIKSNRRILIAFTIFILFGIVSAIDLLFELLKKNNIYNKKIFIIYLHLLILVFWILSSKNQINSYFSSISEFKNSKFAYEIENIKLLVDDFDEDSIYVVPSGCSIEENLTTYVGVFDKVEKTYIDGKNNYAIIFTDEIPSYYMQYDFNVIYKPHNNYKYSILKLYRK